MHVDLFCGLGRYAELDGAETYIREVLSAIARLCADRFEADFAFIAAEKPDRIEIYGGYGHTHSTASLSNGIRSRLGFRGEVVSIADISQEPRLRNHKLFSELDCNNGSVLSVASQPRPGLACTGITLIRRDHGITGSEIDVAFLRQCLDIVLPNIDLIHAAQTMQRQHQVTWQNIDALAHGISNAPVALGIFDHDYNQVSSNPYWDALEAELTFSTHRAFDVADSDLGPEDSVREMIPRPYSPQQNSQMHLSLAKSPLNVGEIRRVIRSVFEESADLKPVEFKMRYLTRSKTLAARDFLCAAYPILGHDSRLRYVGIMLFDGGVAPETTLNATRNSDAIAEGEFTTDFLDRTLLRHSRVQARGGIEYSACRTWRKPLKQEQINALKLGKKLSNPSLLDLAARDICALTRKKYGGIIQSVTAIPCGFSPEAACFSTMLGEVVASMLQVPFLNVFPHTGLKERSGRHKAAKVAAPPPFEAPDSPTLLVDDVVTTGTRMEAYASSLRHAGTHPFCVAWIGPGRGKSAP